MGKNILSGLPIIHTYVLFLKSYKHRREEMSVSCHIWAASAAVAASIFYSARASVLGQWLHPSGWERPPFTGTEIVPLPYIAYRIFYHKSDISPTHLKHHFQQFLSGQFVLHYKELRSKIGSWSDFLSFTMKQMVLMVSLDISHA